MSFDGLERKLPTETEREYNEGGPEVCTHVLCSIIERFKSFSTEEEGRKILFHLQFVSCTTETMEKLPAMN